MRNLYKHAMRHTDPPRAESVKTMKPPELFHLGATVHLKEMVIEKNFFTGVVED